MESSSETDGLTNKERVYAWRTKNAILAWQQKDFDEFERTALELLAIPLLPLWHRCNLNFYLAAVVGDKGRLQFGQKCLRETLHYITVLQDIRASKGEPDPAHSRLKHSAEGLMVQIEARILQLQDKANLERVEQSLKKSNEEGKSSGWFRTALIEIDECARTGRPWKGSKKEDSDTEMAATSSKSESSQSSDRVEGNKPGKIALPIRENTPVHQGEVEMQHTTTSVFEFGEVANQHSDEIKATLKNESKTKPISPAPSAASAPTKLWGNAQRPKTATRERVFDLRSIIMGEEQGDKEIPKEEQTDEDDDDTIS